MKVIPILSIVLVLFGPVSAQRDSPTAAYKRLYAAVKAKNTDAIKKEMTVETLDFGLRFSQRAGKTIEQAFQNGFTATTFSATLPEIRDERIKGNMGAIEVWNSKDEVWEDLPFICEDGAWKLAVGEIFAGTYEQPSKGIAQKEQEAADVSRDPRYFPVKPKTHDRRAVLSPSALSKVVKIVLREKFKPTKELQTIYLSEQFIRKSWLPAIRNVKFVVVNDAEFEKRGRAYFFNEPVFVGHEVQVDFGSGDRHCSASGSSYFFRVTGSRVRRTRLDTGSAWGTGCGRGDVDTSKN